MALKVPMHSHFPAHSTGKHIVFLMSSLLSITQQAGIAPHPMSGIFDELCSALSYSPLVPQSMQHLRHVLGRKPGAYSA